MQTRAVSCTNDVQIRAKREKLQRSFSTGLFSIFRIILLSAISFILLYPILYMISMSLRPLSQVYDPSVVWIPKSITLENITYIFQLAKFKEAFLNSTLISFGSTVFLVLSCSLAGYGFARFNFKFKKVLFVGVLLTILVPPQLLIVPTAVEMKYFDFFFLGNIAKIFTGNAVTVNLLDSVWCMYLPALFGNGIRAGLFIFMFRQCFMGLPKSLEDAAAVDGCGFFRTFFKIMIPCAGSIFVVVGLFSLVTYWNDYYYTGMLFTNTKTISSVLSAIRTTLSDAGIRDTNMVAAYLQTASFISILPPLVLYLVFQRQFTESIARTGIVG